MNISDLPQGSYTPVQPQGLNVNNLAKGSYSPVTPNAPTAPAQQPNLLQSLWNGIVSYGSQVKTAAQQGAGQINDAGNTISTGAPGQNPVVAGAEAGLKGESGLASVISAPLAPIFKPVSSAIQAVGDMVGSVPAIQTFANSPTGQTTARVAQDVSNTGNVAGTILGVDQAVKLPTTLPPKIAAVKDAVDKLTTQTPEEIAAQKTSSDAATTANTQKQLQSVAQDWQRPADSNMSTFNKTRQALAQAPESPQFLAEQGINPFTHIEDGKYQTSDTADSLRQTAGKMSSDTLRPSLQMADYSTPKTPVADVTKAAIEQVKSEKGVTAGDLNTAISNINKESAALKAKYPNGMSLTDMHDEKITYAQNGGYSPIKSASDNIKATANRNLGRALGGLVEKNAPENIPVEETNAYFTKYYKAADYLDTLNGKKAPVTTGQAIARGIAKFGGAAVARHLVPGAGELVSSFAGYQLGKALEHAAENLTNPMRDSFLRNLEITNPPAFAKVQDYLQKAQTGALGNKLLPSSGTIIPPAPSEAAQQASRARVLAPK